MNPIEIQDLTFSYPNEPLLIRKMNRVFDWRSTAIIGQNGAGKTTFMKLLKGLLKPLTGDIRINGKSTAAMRLPELASQMGLVFQNPAEQIFKNNVRDEVLYGPLNIGMSADQAENTMHAALQDVGLEQRIDANPYDLSFPERKLICLASVLAMQTPIILLDEPTMAQDESGKQLLKRLIHKLEQNGRLVIAILHDMDFVAETFTRTMVFQNGTILLDDQTESVFAQTDALHEASLELPHLLQMTRLLGEKKTYLTAEQFIADRQKKMQRFTSETTLDN
ncbi:MAG: ABC transporter ATP-binding protein [Sporolactobacillus sp.]